jgi:hypothetical protein
MRSDADPIARATRNSDLARVRAGVPSLPPARPLALLGWPTCVTGIRVARYRGGISCRIVCISSRHIYPPFFETASKARTRDRSKLRAVSTLLYVRNP